MSVCGCKRATVPLLHWYAIPA